MISYRLSLRLIGQTSRGSERCISCGTLETSTASVTQTADDIIYKSTELMQSSKFIY